MHPTFSALILALILALLSPQATFSYVTSAVCVKLGSAQYSNRIDIPGGIRRWFQYSQTGASCNVDDEWTADCRAVSVQSSTVCNLDGSFSVWDSNRMSCNAYNRLQSAVSNTCGANSGYADCACGVYATSSSTGQTCLIASYTYHASGTAVLAPDGDPAEPETVGFNYSGQTHYLSEERDEAVSDKDVVEDTAASKDVDKAAAQNLRPYPLNYNAEGSPHIWTLGYLGSCSSIT